MAKYLVQAVKREGFAHAYRGGRGWPSAAPVEVEVLDQDECPTIPVDDGPGRKPRQQLHPTEIGRLNWAKVMADGRLSKTPVGLAEAAAEGETWKARAHAMRQRVSEMDDQLREAADAALKAGQEIDRLGHENEDLRKRVKELEAAAARKPAEPGAPAVPASTAATEVVTPAAEEPTTVVEKRGRK